MGNLNRNLGRSILLGQILLLLFFSLNINTFSQQKEKNGFIGIVIGPSFPMADFGNHSDKNANSGYAEKSRLDYMVDFGYRFGKNYGLSASYFVHQYDVDTSKTDLSWGLGGIVAGPMLIIPVTDKILFDLSLNFGYVTGDLSIDHDLVDELMGHGLGIVVKGLVRYNVLKRWCIIAETSYVTTNQRLKIATNKNLQAINLNFGMGFRL
jgi:hypothetical protein